MSPRSLSEIAALSNFQCSMPYAPASLREQTLALPNSVRVPPSVPAGSMGSPGRALSNVQCSMPYGPMPYAPASLREQTLALPISVRVPRLLQQEAWGMGHGHPCDPSTDGCWPADPIQNSKFKIQHASVRSWRELPESSVWVRVVRCACGVWHL